MSLNIFLLEPESAVTLRKSASSNLVAFFHVFIKCCFLKDSPVTNRITFSTDLLIPQHACGGCCHLPCDDPWDISG